MASACSASNVSVGIGAEARELDVENFCPALAVALGRAYYCYDEEQTFDHHPEDREKSIGNWKYRVSWYPDYSGNLIPMRAHAVLHAEQGETYPNFNIYCDATNFAEGFGISFWSSDGMLNVEHLIVEAELLIGDNSDTLLLEKNELGQYEATENMSPMVWGLLMDENAFQVKISVGGMTDKIHRSFDSYGSGEVREALTEVCRTLH